MLIRESQRLDLKEIWLTQQAVDVDTQSMCGQFRIKPGTQAPEGVGVIDLDLKQLGELMIDGFDDLANAIQKSALFSGELCLLVTAWQRQEAETVVGEELRSFLGADVSGVVIKVHKTITFKVHKTIT